MDNITDNIIDNTLDGYENASLNNNQTISSMIINYVIDLECRMFMNNNLVYSITDVLIKLDNFVQIYCKYLTPIPNVIFYNKNEDIVYNVTDRNLKEFIFFEKNECCLDVFGNLYFQGKFIENLLIQFNKDEIYTFHENVVSYIHHKIDIEKNDILIIQSPWNCIGFAEKFNA